MGGSNDWREGQLAVALWRAENPLVCYRNPFDIMAHPRQNTREMAVLGFTKITSFNLSSRWATCMLIDAPEKLCCRMISPAIRGSSSGERFECEVHVSLVSIAVQDGEFRPLFPVA